MATAIDPRSGDTPAPTPRDPKAVTRARRRAARSRFWATYRSSRSGIVGLAILLLFIGMAVFAPLLADKAGLDVTQVNGPILAPPSWQYPLGTDDTGRSVLTLVIWGSRISLLVGLFAAVVSMSVGALIGIVAGYRGGATESVLMRLTDWFLVIPFLPLAIVLASILGRSLIVIIFVIGVSIYLLARQVLLRLRAESRRSSISLERSPTPVA